MKILVTGANGYIGSHVTKELLNAGHKVIAVDIKADNIDKRATIKTDNIFSQEQDLYHRLEEPEAVIHFACKDVPVHNSLNHINTLADHFNFLKNMIDNGVKKVATIGSMHEVGYFEGAVTENTPTNPQTFYGIAKDTLRRLIAVYTQDKNIKHYHLRFFYTFGDDEYSSGSLFSKILSMSKEGKTTFPFTDGLNKFDYIHIKELSKQVCAVIEQDNITGIINCCSGQPVMIKDMVNKFLTENNLNIKPNFGTFPSRPYDSPCLYGDNTKIQQIMKARHE